MADQLDVSLQDDELLAEIALATRLMIVASHSEHRLTSTELDRALGLSAAMPPQRTAPGAEQDRP